MTTTLGDFPGAIHCVDDTGATNIAPLRGASERRYVIEHSASLMGHFDCIWNTPISSAIPHHIGHRDPVSGTAVLYRTPRSCIGHPIVSMIMIIIASPNLLNYLRSMINWGIIGCGNVTEVKSGPAFNKVANSRLLAVMRRNSAKAEDYARRHQVPLWFDDAHQIIDHPEINAVYVATPPSSHEQYATAAMKAGKFVYLEKPMSTSSSSAQAIANVAEQARGKLCVAHYRRRQPMFLKIKSLLQEGIIGKLRKVTMICQQPPATKLIAQTEDNWRLKPEISGGGLFYDLAPHQLDLMLYYLGSPLHVSGSSANVGGFYDVPDTTTVEIQFPEEVHFRGHWSFVSNDAVDSCEITGTGGSIQFSVFNRNPVIVTTDGKQQMLSFEPLQHVQQPMIEKVVDYFLGVAANPCTAEEGVEVMRMIDATGGIRI